MVVVWGEMAMQNVCHRDGVGVGWVHVRCKIERLGSFWCDEMAVRNLPNISTTLTDFDV